MEQQAEQRVFFVVAQEAAQYYKERNKLEKCGISITDQERSLMRTAELLEIIRNGENSGVEFKRDDIHPEQLAKEIVNMETLPVAGTSIDSLDLDRLNFYLASIIEDPDVPGSREQWIERLLGLGLMAEDGLGNKVCSIAGLVCFGIRPRRYLP
ncbi:hypothetical protein GCAAIG_05410 [Candidatus Electronema halotolerans]